MKALGDRMKKQYENRSRIYLQRRTYTIIRIDGKAFHTYTRGLERPFDIRFCADMDKTAEFLCRNIQGAQFAYVQSDEISILLTDFETITTEAWFDANLQKMCSVSASLATAFFNTCRPGKMAMFDSRVFQIADRTEVENYFIWRQRDAITNSIQSLAQSLYSHSELENKNCNDLQEMCFQKGSNWNDIKASYKRGRLIAALPYYANADQPEILGWRIEDSPDFLKSREVFGDLIPKRS